MAEPSYPFTTYVGVPKDGRGTPDGIHLLEPRQMNIDNEGTLYWIDGSHYVYKKPANQSTYDVLSTIISIDVTTQVEPWTLAASPSGNVFLLNRETYNPLAFQNKVYEITDGGFRYVGGGSPSAKDSTSFPNYFMAATDGLIYLTGVSLLENTTNPGSDYHGELQSMTYGGRRTPILPEDYPSGLPPFWGFFPDPDLPDQWIYQAEKIAVDPEGNTYLFAGFVPGAGFSFSGALQSDDREYSVYKVSPAGDVSIHQRLFKAGLGLNQDDVVLPRGITWAMDGNVYVSLALRLSTESVPGRGFILKLDGGSSAQTITEWKEQSSDPDEILGEGARALRADPLGNLYFTVNSLGGRGGSRAYTIQKMGGVFEPAPMLSSKQDDFSSGDVSGWAETGLYSVTNEVLTLGDVGTISTLKTTDTYIYDSVFGQFKPQGATDFTVRVENSTDPSISSQFWMHGSALDMMVDGATVGSVTYNKTSHEWLRMVRSGSTVTFSAAGSELVKVCTSDQPEYQTGPKAWTTLGSGTIGPVPLCNFMILVSSSALQVDNINILPNYPSEEPLPPPPPDPYGDTDPKNPDSKAPPVVKEKTCTTYLDEVRLFSNRAGQAVRITGPRRIEMVNRSGLVPIGWTQAEAPELYHSASRELKIGEHALSIRAGFLSMNGEASLISNDVRILGSSWRLPGKLPVYGLEPAAVQRVTFTFTKEEFNANVVFAFNPIPLKVRPT